jgi:hypothetical protein
MLNKRDIIVSNQAFFRPVTDAANAAGSDPTTLNRRNHQEGTP